VELAAKIARLRPMGSRVDALRAEIDRILTRPVERASAARSEPKASEVGWSGSAGPGADESVRRPRPSLGRREATAYGEIWRTRSDLEPDHVHGRVPVAKALGVDPKLVAELALDPSLAEIDLGRAVYLDCETTGLRGGTGTVAFLIGLGSFEDRSFAVEQLFLPELGEEAPMLEWVRARIDASSAIVTFNGKAFDWPLLQARYVSNRVAPPPVRPHLDLLHCARRIYRRRLGGVRLADVEERVLGMRRERDVDGAEIPGLYWSFLRHKNTDSIQPIVEHNANDLVALAAMLGHLSERFARVFAEDEPVDHLARAKLAHRAGDHGRSARFALAASEGGGEPEITTEAHVLLAAIAKASRDLDAFERHLGTALAAAPPSLAPPIHLDLAKLYEHRRKDFDRALEHARNTGAIEGHLGSAKRVARLEKKRDRSRS
jgi:hypothetical protein